MNLSFRQGIARHQTDALATPTFLQRSRNSGLFVDLVVAPDPTIIVFAHRTANYVVEELRTVPNAWGPISGSQTVYLFWDINMLTGELTRGTTVLPPIIGTAPADPATDQHWFDTNDTVMRVWNGSKWVEKIRVFAGYLSSGSIIRPYNVGSQVGITGSFEGGSLVLDSYNKPLRQSDGTFITSTTSLLIVNGGANKVKFETHVMGGMALEPLPKFSLVQVQEGRRLVLARSNNVMSRIAGIVLEDLHVNEVGYIVTDGLIRNEQWNWPASSVNRPVFCGLNGEITIVPPKTGVLQAAGFVYDTDSIYMNIFMPIVLDPRTAITPPPAPAQPIADFTVDAYNGELPFTVQFTDLTVGNPTTWEWDFTNDGVFESAQQHPSFTYEEPGTYTVRLRVTNTHGADDEIKTALITVLNPQQEVHTNLGVRLAGPNQLQRNDTDQVSISVSNDGHETATQVERIITIPDINGHKVHVSDLPDGSAISRNGSLTVVSLPIVETIGSGLTYGPTVFTVKAPPTSGTIRIQAVVESPEADPTPGDNTTSLSIQVRP